MRMNLKHLYEQLTGRITTSDDEVTLLMDMADEPLGNIRQAFETHRRSGVHKRASNFLLELLASSGQRVCRALHLENICAHSPM